MNWMRPAFPGMPFKPWGFRTCNESEETNVALMSTTNGHFALDGNLNATGDGGFSDFVWEFPYRGEKRTGRRDSDFGFFIAEHAVTVTRTGGYIDDDAQDR